MHHAKRDLGPLELFPSKFALFTESEGKYAGHVLLAHCISVFICNSTQVTGIVNLLYKHSDAVSYRNRQADKHQFTRPRYTLAPMLCLQWVLLTPLPNSTKMNWALSVVMDLVNIESTRSAECPTFVCISAAPSKLQHQDSCILFKKDSLGDGQRPPPARIFSLGNAASDCSEIDAFERVLHLVFI